MSKYLMASYKQLPVGFAHGSGACLTDESGQDYLDALSGIAVCCLGHAHPKIIEAINDQAAKVIHTSNLYHIPLQERLAARLIELSNMSRVFFCNSGAEANEAAIKIARLHGHSKNIETPAIIVAHKSFHGRTMATLSATGNPSIQTGFEPMVEGFIHVPFNDIEAISDIVLHDPDIAAVMLEPIQGEGGIIVPDQGYLRAIRTLCDEHDLILILDEIQTGMCRTGKWFAHQHEDILPDVMTLAKALGNGVPIGACIARGMAANLIQPGSHGSTFGGNPLAARVGLAVIDQLAEHQLAYRAAELGAMMLDGLRSRLEDINGVRDIRGMGLMIGIELERPCTELMKLALAEYLLLNVTSENVIRLLPPLIISEEQAGVIVNRVSDLVIRFLEQEK